MRRLALTTLVVMAAGVALLQVANAEPEIRVARTAAFAQAVDVDVKPPPYWRTRGCTHGYRSKVSYQKVRRLMRHHQPYVNKKLVRRLAVCQFTRAKSRAVWRVVKASWKWRWSYAHKWPIKFNSLPAAWQNWAYATGACESGNNPRAYNPAPFFGAFQFVLSTWYAAGGTGNPMDHSWHYQAWIAVHWRMRSSASQWPVCSAW